MKLGPDGRLPSDLWLDQSGAAAAIRQRLERGEISARHAALLERFHGEGYCVVPLNLPSHIYQELDADVERLWRERPPDMAFAYQSLLTRFSGPQDVDQRQPSCRLADLHTFSPAARNLYLHPDIFHLAGLIFGQPAVATQSLYFEWGSQQALHRDPIHVQMSHPAHLLAAWIALEDIDPRSGPLLYVPGSHRLPYYEFAPGRFVYDDQQDGLEGIRAAESWDRERYTEAGLTPKPFLAQRGEMLLWHHSLLHGGSPPAAPAPTRKSFVVHFTTRAHMSEAANTYLDPFAGMPGAPPQRVSYSTQRKLGLDLPELPLGFESPLHTRFREETRSLYSGGGPRLRRQLEAMEMSTFWKLRNAWFGLKRAVGLTRER